MTPTPELAAAVRAGDRRALARAITLVESTRPDHRDDAVALLEELLPATGGATRVGISGAPGAGKSTFIEALGTHVVDTGHRVAVLAVDPSSARSGGSILGDKTRMEQLSRRPEAFIRPSPSGGTLGGVARRTREALLVCEAAGFDVVLVETVGVGQSEIAVAGMVDLFLLLLAPGGGDELQGVKRGIVELADLLVVNKCDGALADLARHTAADYGHALHLVRTGDAAAIDRVRTCSALLGEGIDEVWNVVEDLVLAARASGELDEKRTDQARSWMWSEVTDTLLDDLRADAAVRAQIDALEHDVTHGRMSPAAAARQVLAAFAAMNTGARRGFEALTESGRHRRLRRLALDALRAYDLDVARCTFVARSFNSVFRVDTTGGDRAPLRISPDLRIHADGCELVEAEWIRALRRDVDFPTPAVRPARDGSVVVSAAAADVPGARTCVLFDWVTGRRLREGITPGLVRKTGELAAIVHEHGAGYLAQAPAGALVADRVCYFRGPDRLDRLRPAYGSALTDAVLRAQAALDRLWRDPPHPPHLLHGDIQPGNVMVSRGNVVLIDFQDLIWGFEIQDVGIALQALEHIGDPDGTLRAAFRAGYQSRRPWPEADGETIAALQAARHLNILDFGMVGRPGLDEFVARHAAPVVAWMSS